MIWVNSFDDLSWFKSSNESGQKYYWFSKKSRRNLSSKKKLHSPFQSILMSNSSFLYQQNDVSRQEKRFTPPPLTPNAGNALQQRLWGQCRVLSTLHSPSPYPTLTLHSESFAKEPLVCLRRYINNHKWTKIISWINIYESFMDFYGHSCSVADKRKVHVIHV